MPPVIVDFNDVQDENSSIFKDKSRNLSMALEPTEAERVALFQQIEEYKEYINELKAELKIAHERDDKNAIIIQQIKKYEREKHDAFINTFFSLVFASIGGFLVTYNEQILDFPVVLNQYAGIFFFLLHQQYLGLLSLLYLIFFGN
jgi:hypothetical protein